MYKSFYHRKNFFIRGLNKLIKTDGGRVLCVTALGKNISEAQLNAYNYVKQIKWKDCFYRTDIGYRAVERES